MGFPGVSQGPVIPSDLTCLTCVRLLFVLHDRVRTGGAGASSEEKRRITRFEGEQNVKGEQHVYDSSRGCSSPTCKLIAGSMWFVQLTTIDCCVN